MNWPKSHEKEEELPFSMGGCKRVPEQVAERLADKSRLVNSHYEPHPSIPEAYSLS